MVYFPRAEVLCVAFASYLAILLVKWANVSILFCCALCEGFLCFTETIRNNLLWFSSSWVSAYKVSWVSLGWVIGFKICFLRLTFLRFHSRSVGWSCIVLNITLILQSDVSDRWGKLQDCFRYPCSEWRHKNISLFNYYEVSQVFSFYRYCWFILKRVLEAQSLAGHVTDLMQSVLGINIGVSFTDQFSLNFNLNTSAPWGSFWVTSALSKLINKCRHPN